LSIAGTALIILFSFLEEGEGRRESRSTNGTRAALNFRSTVRVLANQFTFGFRASGFVAFPVALGLFTDGFALRFRSLAMGDAVRLFANSDALRAVEHFAAFVGALDFALRLLAFDITDSVFWLSAGSVALGRLTDGIADCRAVGVIALPGALGMAGILSLQVETSRNSDHSDYHQS
jgi:hypothetical protein